VTVAVLPKHVVRRLSLGPWLWSKPVDLAVFGGSALLALALVLVGHLTGFSSGALPEWGWVVLVLGIDVAHVYSTLFRTYFDRRELGRHPLRYVLVPLVVYACGVGLYLDGALTFWRVLAYVALFHFIRQQVGWVAVYRARAGKSSTLDRVLDEAAVYAATLYPVLHWHAHLADTHFAWFVQGDFVDLGALARAALPVAELVWVLALSAFALRQFQRGFHTGSFELGKSLVVATTAATWYVGIVATNSDFDFTVTNVIVHGVPYVALLWAYARERGKEDPDVLGSQIAAGGIGAFAGVLLLLAFVEEMAWDRMVWNDREWLFGSGTIALPKIALALLVPLLALPQGVHYVLDGLLWRRADTRSRPAQRAALGWERA
jgi:hypothetical protein